MSRLTALAVTLVGILAFSATMAAATSSGAVMKIFEGHNLLSSGAFVSLDGVGANVSFSGEEGTFSCTAASADFFGVLRYNGEAIDEIELEGAGGALAGDQCGEFHGAAWFPWKLSLYASHKAVASDGITLDVGECTYEANKLSGGVSTGLHNLIVDFGGPLHRSKESPRTCGKKITFSSGDLDTYGANGPIWGKVESAKSRKEE